MKINLLILLAVGLFAFSGCTVNNYSCSDRNHFRQHQEMRQREHMQNRERHERHERPQHERQQRQQRQQNREQTEQRPDVQRYQRL